MSLNIKIKGLDTALAELSVEKLNAKVNKALYKFGQNVDREAKQLAPVDEGGLRQSIFYKVEGATVKVGATKDYAAYVEFGTRKFAAAYVATLPSNWQQFAASFKGPGGGSFEEFVMRLTRWVLAKGIGETYSVSTRRRDRVGKQSAQTTAEADAYAIALHILRNGIRAQPFLYPAVRDNTPILIKDIESK